MITEENISKVKEEVQKYYSDLGYEIIKYERQEMGVYQLKDLSMGLSIADSDIELFLDIKNKTNIDKIYIIGNAFGYSTFVLANIFPKSKIDVIDAECEGFHNTLGTEITRKIIDKYKLDINLTIGFSPEDVEKSVRFEKYDLIFIDGLHTNLQLSKDLEEMKKYCFDKTYIVCHDVELCNLQESINEFLDKNKDFEYEKYDSKINNNFVGTGFFIKRG